MTGGKYYEFFKIENEKMEKMSDNMCEAANAFGFLKKERDELQKELKRHKEALEYVFARAELAKLHAKTDAAHEYLVQIREKEEALKKGEAILND